MEALLSETDKRINCMKNFAIISMAALDVKTISRINKTYTLNTLKSLF